MVFVVRASLDSTENVDTLDFRAFDDLALYINCLTWYIFQKGKKK